MMHEYMRYWIENHPSISSEYVKFLVTNSSTREQGSGMEDKIEKMEERLDEVEKVATGAKSTSGSASNVLDHLKRRVEKVEKK